jgi:hypothetical protein
MKVAVVVNKNTGKVVPFEFLDTGEVFIIKESGINLNTKEYYEENFYVTMVDSDNIPLYLGRIPPIDLKGE